MWQQWFAPAVAFLLCSPLTNALSVNPRATTCNGHSELCSKSYGTVSFVGAHDSYAVGINTPFANQDYDVTQQLTDGIRLLQLQVHNQAGVLQLCHSDCGFLNAGTLESYLGKVKTWMDANSNDVVSILIVNIDNRPTTAFATVFAAAGLDKISYSPPSSSLTFQSWPTLGEMIDAGTRLVTYLDNQADFATVPYLIDEFTNIWETAFDVTDTTFNCDVNRTNGDSSTHMYLINHFLDKLVFGVPAPDVANANITNGVSGVGSLQTQVDTCVAANTRAPNFLLVDFYEYGGGSVFQVAATINGVTYAPTSPIATPIPTSSSASTPSATSKNGSSPTKVLASIAFGASAVL
ncbi:PLC-like phosphodiesterase [Mycena floridula]|nr:PLC-like phosphodiesterase [Mycena floridula]